MTRYSAVKPNGYNGGTPMPGRRAQTSGNGRKSAKSSGTETSNPRLLKQEDGGHGNCGQIIRGRTP